MKKINAIFFLALSFLAQKNYAQSTVTGPVVGHIGAAGFYSGWDASAASNAIHFDLEHRGIMNINFKLATVQRMNILGTGSGTPGFVGIGNTFTPLNLLHLREFGNTTVTGNLFRTDGIQNATQTNVWQMFTGTTVATMNEKFRLFTLPSGNWTNLAFSERDFGLQASQRHMFFRTGNTAAINPPTATRMWINGFKSGTIHSAPGINTTGYIGIGDFNGVNSSLNPNSGNYTGPKSLLQLTGPNSIGSLTNGWRSWMQTGIYYERNTDAMYVGLKEISPNQDDAVINWSDDLGVAGGADKLKFIFTNNNTGNGNGTNPKDGNSFDGYEFMRMIPSGPNNLSNFPAGYIGIGPVFTNAAPPTSRLHMNSEDWLENYVQITSELGTGQGATDGLKMGILNTNLNLQRSGNAFIYNQENRHLIFGTAWPTPVNINTTRERMRLTRIGAPTNLPAGGYGVYNPAAFTNNDITRMSISHNPTQPVTRPLSLLHLGYNTGANSFPLGSTDGWRDWMDIGIFTSNGTDNCYWGLKREPNPLGFANDRFDAVINWGDNQSPGALLPNGPDLLRFIFTSTTSGVGGAPPATGNDGLELGRFYPYRDTLGKYGRFGIGDFTAAGLNQQPTHKLDVDGNGRFRLLPDTLYRLDSLELDTLAKIVFVDTNGVLRWEYMDSLKIGGVGNYCADPQNALTGNYEIPLDSSNYYFSGQGGIGTNQVNIGFPCGTGGNSKFKVLQANAFPAATGTPQPAATWGASIVNLDYNPAPLSTSNYTGVQGISQNPGTIAINANQRKGVWGFARYGKYSWGVHGAAQTDFNGEQIGGYFEINSSTITGAGFSAAVVGIAPVAPNSFAGYFNGQVGALSYTIISDTTYKKNMAPITNAVSTIMNLNPISYDYDLTKGNTDGLNLPPEKNYGFKAQELETVFPELVLSQRKPTELDSAGNVVHPAVDYKAVNYTAFAGILTKGIQEQQLQITNLSKTPDAPTLVSPANNATGDYHQVTLTWNSVSSGLVMYHVQIAKDSTFTIISSESDTRDTTISVGLDSAQWFWRVKAINNFGSSAWSATFNFKNTVNPKDGGPRDFPQSTLSDNSLKQNVNTLTGSLDKVKQLRGVDYKWNANGLALMKGDTSKQIGLIAQEVKNVVPEVVYEEDSILHVDYQHLAPVFVEAIKELAKKDSLKNIKMNSMQAQLDSIKNVMAACCSNQNDRVNQNTAITEIDVDLTGRDQFFLGQNTPNPFSTKTEIKFNIPDFKNSAQIIFYDSNGELLKSVNIQTKGQGQLNLSVSEFANGVYSYVLIVDGNLKATKKMIKAE